MTTTKLGQRFLRTQGLGLQLVSLVGEQLLRLRSSTNAMLPYVRSYDSDS